MHEPSSVVHGADDGARRFFRRNSTGSRAPGAGGSGSAISWLLFAMTAIGLSAISLPDLTGGERLFLGVFALAFLGLLWAQWGLASIPASRTCSAWDEHILVGCRLIAHGTIQCSSA